MKLQISVIKLMENYEKFSFKYHGMMDQRQVFVCCH